MRVPRPPTYPFAYNCLLLFAFRHDLPFLRVSSYLSTLGSPLSLRVSLFSCERVVESSLVSDLQEAYVY